MCSYPLYISPLVCITFFYYVYTVDKSHSSNFLLLLWLLVILLIVSVTQSVIQSVFISNIVLIQSLVVVLSLDMTLFG